MSSIASSKWFVHDQNTKPENVRLFVFPHGGGSPSQYREWQTFLGEDCKVYIASLPGRGARFLEDPIADMEILIASLSEAILPLLGPYNVFFGHSLGSAVAYELAKVLESDHAKKLQKLIVSAKNAPHIPSDAPQLHQLPDTEFIDSLRQYGGTPDEILSNSELMELQLPMLRADFALSESYFCQEIAKLKCPITVFSGDEDRFTTQEGLRQWEQYSTPAFNREEFGGGHFYFLNALPDFFNSLKREISTVFLGSNT